MNRVSNLVVIIGITGVQGGSVADVYPQTSDWKVEVVNRDISSTASKVLASKGVGMVTGDLNDASSLVPAFHGATAAFRVTDFWGIFRDPASWSGKEPDQDITEYCGEVEFQQGKNIADAAARDEGLCQFIFSSMANVTKWSHEKFKRLCHMNSKAGVVEYAKETAGAESKVSQIQPSIYYNLLWELSLPTTPLKDASGKYRIKEVGNGNVSSPLRSCVGIWAIASR